MGVPTQKFEGIETNIPGIYTESEFPPTLGAVQAPTNIVAIIGKGKGGVPYNASGVDDEDKVNVISSVAQALDLIRGGDSLYMAEFYLDPTKDPTLNTPARCLYFRVDPASAAQRILQDGGSNNIIQLDTTRYGAFANQLARKIEAGTNLGHKVTVKLAGEELVQEDDIGYEYMTIEYTGAGSAADLTITDTTLSTTVTGGPGGEDLSMTLSEFPTLGDVVAYINEQPAYSASLKYRSNAKSDTFDAVTSQSIFGSPYTAVAHVQALLDFFNLRAKGEIVATYVGSARNDVANDSNFIFFTGGSDGTASNSDWADTLELMKKFRINHVLAATGDPAIHTMVDQHVRDMSGIEEKKNRSAGYGAELNKTVSTRIDEMKALNSQRSEYWFTPFRRPDILNNNEAKEFDPFYLAAMGAGIRFGNDVTISATFKQLNILGVSETYDRPTKKQIIDAGGSIVGRDETGSGFSVIHNVTTYQGVNLILNLPSMLRTADAITLDSQVKIQRRIANLKKAPTAMVIKDMENYLKVNLLPFYRDEVGWLTDDPFAERPAFSDVQFTIKGDRFDFSFTGIIPAPLHFGFIKQRFVVIGFAGE